MDSSETTATETEYHAAPDHLVVQRVTLDEKTPGGIYLPEEARKDKAPNLFTIIDDSLDKDSWINRMRESALQNPFVVLRTQAGSEIVKLPDNVWIVPESVVVGLVFP